MQFGLDVAQHQLTWDELLERVRFAEGLGFTGVWIFDHFKALYGDPNGPCLEAWTLLAALAAATKSIRLGTLVTGITYRSPSILATEAITVDHVSRGRLELALGAAWHEGEHRELGIEFPSSRERIERLGEAVEVMRLLMTTDDASFAGKYYRLDHATYRPRPVQQPHPPIWVGGGGEKLMLPLIAREADVWHGFGSLDVLRRKSEMIDRLAREVGREPSAIRRSTALSLEGSLESVARHVTDLQEAGFSYLTVGWPAEGKGKIEELAKRLIPS